MPIFTAAAKKGGRESSRLAAGRDRRAFRMPKDRMRTAEGLTIMDQASHRKGDLRRRAARWARERNISLASMPHRRAAMPNRGMPKNTNPRRRDRAAAFWRKVRPVAPRPFRMLPVVEDR